MTSEKTETRRRYSAAMKAQMVAACDELGASMAKVAMAHGINANVVHRWRQRSQGGFPAAPAKTSEFIALPLATPAMSAAVAADVPERLAGRRFAVQASSVVLLDADTPPVPPDGGDVTAAR